MLSSRLKISKDYQASSKSRYILVKQNKEQNWIVSGHIAVFRTLFNIYDGALCENSYPLLAVNYFRKKFHLRKLTGLWLRLRVSISFFGPKDEICAPLDWKLDFRVTQVVWNGLFPYILVWLKQIHCPTNIYLFKFNNINTRRRCKICSKLTIKTLEWRHWCHSGVFIVDLNIFHTFFYCFYYWLWASNC